MIKILQRRFALSEQGAVDLIKGCIACVAQDISFMIPVGLLYFLVIDMMNGGVSKKHVAFYAVGALVCLCLIFIATWFQYNATYLATYVESGVRRISLAEQIDHKIFYCSNSGYFRNLRSVYSGKCSAVKIIEEK